METFFLWIYIFMKFGSVYFPRQRYNLRINYSDRTGIAYSCLTNWAIQSKIMIFLCLLCYEKCTFEWYYSFFSVLIQLNSFFLACIPQILSTLNFLFNLKFKNHSFKLNKFMPVLCVIHNKISISFWSVQTLFAQNFSVVFARFQWFWMAQISTTAQVLLNTKFVLGNCEPLRLSWVMRGVYSERHYVALNFISFSDI